MQINMDLQNFRDIDNLNESYKRMGYAENSAGLYFN